MPKQKSHKGLSKRVRLTASGKVNRKKAGAGHLMSTKRGKRIRNLRQATMMNSTLARKLRPLISD